MATSQIDISAGFLDEPKRTIDISAGFEQPGPASISPAAQPRPSIPEPQRGFMAGLRGGGEGPMAAVGRFTRFPYDIAKTAGTPPTEEESTLYKLGGPGAVATKRMLVDPSMEMFRRAAVESREGETLPSLGYRAAGALPLVGPIAADIGERAGRGDVSGAATEGVLNAALLGLPRLLAGGKGLRSKPPKPTPVPAERVSLPTPERAVSPTAAPALPSTAIMAQQMVEAAGSRWRGVQKGMEGMGEKFPDLALFDDPQTGSTLALPVREVTPQAIARKFQESRADFARPRKPIPEPRRIERRQKQRDPAEVRELFAREAERKRKAEAGPKPVIEPKLLQKMREDIRAVKKTGTFSEALKPEVRAGARAAAHGEKGPAELLAIKTRQGFIDAIRSVDKVAEKAQDGSPAYAAALRATENLFGLAAEEMALARRDPAMALRVYKQEPLSTKLTASERKTAVKLLKDSPFARSEKIIELINDIQPTWSDMFFEFWKNGLLSGVKTHAIQALSNLTSAAAEVSRRGVAGGTDFFRAKLTGTPQERFIGETAPAVYGSFAGFPDGVRLALRSFITEEPQFGTARVELPRPKAIPGLPGKVIRTPGNAMMMGDEFFKQVIKSGSIHARAYRAAAMEGKVGLERALRIQELIDKTKGPLKKMDDLTMEMVESAEADAVYGTFQKELGPVGEMFSRGRSITFMGTGFKPGHLFLPFLRTVGNLPKWALEHTPLNFIRIAIKRLQKNPDFMAGKLSDELAKPILGTMVGYLAYDLASRGLITGSGPSDPAERRVWLEMYQPDSFRIGDQWISLRRFDPYSTDLGMAADLFESKTMMDEGEFEEAAIKMAFSFTTHISSRTWMEGMSNLLDAGMHPDRYGQKFIQRLAGSMVPTTIADLSRLGDPAYRQPRSVGEAVKARIPGLAEEIEPLRGVFGETVPRDIRGPIERTVSPFPRIAIPDDPATREIVRLKMRIGRPSRQITIRGEQREMTRQEYEQYVTESGERAQQRINRLVADPNYQRLTDEQRERFIKRIFDKERDRARRRIAAAPPARELVSQ